MLCPGGQLQPGAGVVYWSTILAASKHRGIPPAAPIRAAITPLHTSPRRLWYCCSPAIALPACGSAPPSTTSRSRHPPGRLTVRCHQSAGTIPASWSSANAFPNVQLMTYQVNNLTGSCRQQWRESRGLGAEGVHVCCASADAWYGLASPGLRLPGPLQAPCQSRCPGQTYKCCELPRRPLL